MFVPVNRAFKFVSIYPRLRGLRVLLRFLINVLYIWLFNKLKNNKRILSQSIWNKVLRYTVNGIVSLDYINIVTNLLFVGTSIHKGVSPFDTLVIFVDLGNMIFFQFELLKIY